MATEWGFLEPWRTVLRDNLIQSETQTVEPTVEVSFVYPDGKFFTHRQISLRVSRRDAPRRQRLREAMELFTMLALVNNRAFRELILALLGFQLSHNVLHPNSVPRWNIHLIESSLPNDPAVESDVSWGTFLGFPDDPLEYSPEFRAAAERLEAMGVDRFIVSWWDGGSGIYWKCRLQYSRLEGNQEPLKTKDELTSIRSHLRRLFDVVVPPMVLLIAAGGSTSSVSTLNRANCQSVTATMRAWDHPVLPKLTMTLADTSASMLTLDLGTDLPTTGSPQAMMDAGLMLNALICGRSLCSNTTEFRHTTYRSKYGKLDLICYWACNRLVTAICSPSPSCL